MGLITLDGLTPISGTQTDYFAINYAAQVTPFVAYTETDVEINGKIYSPRDRLIRLPISLQNEELTDISAEPYVRKSFTHGGKQYEITAYLGSQKYTPPTAWQWSFRWSDVPPYYLPDAARASFNATPLRSVCDDYLVVWLNEAGQMLGLPVAPLSETSEAGGVEMIQKIKWVPEGDDPYFVISRTPTGAIYATAKFSTPPLTADDVRKFCSLGSARYAYLSKSGILMPIEISGSFSWSVVGTGECATFSTKIYSKNTTYVNG